MLIDLQKNYKKILLTVYMLYIHQKNDCVLYISYATLYLHLKSLYTYFIQLYTVVPKMLSTIITENTILTLNSVYL